MTPAIFTAVFWIFLAVNLGITIFNVEKVFHHEVLVAISRSSTYTYMGDDFPLEYPIAPLEHVATTLHETVRLQLYGDDPISMQEWQLLETLPKGYGRVRLGPEHRLFLIGMFHQFHCLRAMELRLRDKNSSYIDAEHYGHCLNYLRQTLLCDANNALEEGDFTVGGINVDRVGSTMVCRDWEKLYADMSQNDDDFGLWAKDWN